MFQRFFDDGLAQASFLLACPVAREAVIIDPRRDVDAYVEVARANASVDQHTAQLFSRAFEHVHGATGSTFPPSTENAIENT